MTNEKYKKKYIYAKASININKKYDPDGEGNIIHIPGCKDDLRDVEIWCQMCWYLDSVL